MTQEKSGHALRRLSFMERRETNRVAQVKLRAPKPKVTVIGLDKPTPATPATPVTPAITEHVEAINAANPVTPPSTGREVAEPDNYSMDELGSMSDAELHALVMGATAPAPASASYKPKTTAEKLASIPLAETGFPRIADETLLAMPSVKRLLDMLTYMRPHNSTSEEQFIHKFIVNRPDGKPRLGVSKDKYGNRWVRVNNPDGTKPAILWSAHTDTVHTKPGTQTVCFGDGKAYAEDSSCLGADDGAGVWLLLEMIEAGVPGVYIFHRDEEHGGHGSAHIVKAAAGWSKTQNKFDGIKAAIAFDRRGYDSVITFQQSRVCCSQGFARSVGSILGGKFRPDSTGTFTDTANYTHLIGECTNISVGYHQAHGPMEWLDVGFLVSLRDKIVAADWSKLEFSRAPTSKYAPSRSDDWAGYGYGGTRSYYQDRNPPASAASPAPAAKSASAKATSARMTEEERVDDMAFEWAMRKARQLRKDIASLADTVALYPDTVTMFLIDHGFTTTDIEDWFKEQDPSLRKQWDSV